MPFGPRLLMLAAVPAFAADLHPGETLRGKLVLRDQQAAGCGNGRAQARDPRWRRAYRKVLGDERLNGFEVEAKGRFSAADRFLIDPIHTRALLVRQGGQLRMVTYWCDPCPIRSSLPAHACAANGKPPWTCATRTNSDARRARADFSPYDAGCQLLRPETSAGRRRRGATHRRRAPHPGVDRAVGRQHGL